MDNEIYGYGAVLLAIYGYFYWECHRHRENLQKIPLRIHVNGTRGKSSVTRLIAAGLRAGGYQVFAKTTGTEAKFIFPDGSEQYIPRSGPANIKENITFINQAAGYGAAAVVVECMAICPDLQHFMENRLLQSHIGVITNIRDDHEDVMGDGLDNIAVALSNTIPRNGRLVTTPAAASLLQKIDPKAGLIIADGKAVAPCYLEGFAYEIIPDNIAVALQVCRLAGVEPAAAIAGMRQAVPDAGNFKISQLVIGNKTVTSVNALAANDPESTLWLWQRQAQLSGHKVILLNCRSDRKFRTAKLCEALGAVYREGSFILAGDSGFARRLLQSLCPQAMIYSLSDNPAFGELAGIFEKWPDENIVLFAAGNIKGFSAEFLKMLNGEHNYA